MTSPSQLKYLDAMGIPVWVSRDLVILDETVKSDSESNIDLNVNNAVKQPTQQTSQSGQNARNILESLEDSSVKTGVQSKQKEPNVIPNKVLNESIEAAVDSAKLTEKTSSEFSTTSSLNTSNNTTVNLLLESSHHYIYAEGDESADWMVVGHSPEPFNGIGQEPFAEDAGKLLDNMLRAVGIEYPRKQAYILNVLEVNQSVDESQKQKATLELNKTLLSVIDKVKPKILLLVGQIAAQNLLESTEPLVIMRSKSHNVSKANIPCVVTYYPSYLLLKPIDKRKAWDDLKLAMRLLED